MRIDALFCAAALSVFASQAAFAFDAATDESNGAATVKPHAVAGGGRRRPFGKVDRMLAEG